MNIVESKKLENVVIQRALHKRSKHLKITTVTTANLYADPKRSKQKMPLLHCCYLPVYACICVGVGMCVSTLTVSSSKMLAKMSKASLWLKTRASASVAATV